jgi:putative SOS response-associated peptidase YedK
MPVVVPEAAWESWLDTSMRDAGELFGLFEPSDEIELRIWPVRPLVNNVRNDGPELFEPIEIEAGAASAAQEVQHGFFDEVVGS